MSLPILATTVPHPGRIRALRSAFGSPLVCALVENSTFSALSRLSVEHLGKAYNGGFWEYITLSNGGFFLHPALGQDYRLFCAGNGAEEVVSGEAAGIVATLFSLSSLAMRLPTQEILADRYHQLLDFARGRPDYEAIASLID
jgi:hypothetical protein